MKTIKDKITEEINHTWDGKIFAYQHNTCEYVDITDFLKELLKSIVPEEIDLDESGYDEKDRSAVAYRQGYEKCRSEILTRIKNIIE